MLMTQNESSDIKVLKYEEKKKESKRLSAPIITHSLFTSQVRTGREEKQKLLRES